MRNFVSRPVRIRRQFASCDHDNGIGQVAQVSKVWAVWAVQVNCNPIFGLGTVSLGLDCECPCYPTVYINIQRACWGHAARAPSQQSLGDVGGSSELKPNIWIGRCISRKRSRIQFGCRMPEELRTYMTINEFLFVFDVWASMETGMYISFYMTPCQNILNGKIGT